MHSALSGDAVSPQDRMAAAAIEMGCKYIALTEHSNLDFAVNNIEMATTDLALYDAEIKKLKANFAGKLDITYGLEVGYDEKASHYYADSIKRYGYDYVINSVHLIKGGDCYWEAYFKGRKQKEVFQAYLNEVYESLSAPYRFNTLGHFGYITRNCPYSDRDMLRDYGDIVKSILIKIIETGVALEVNTAVCTAPAPFVPQREIVKYYRELGGGLVVYGSDAHSDGSVCRSREQAMAALKECGFKYHAIFPGGKLKMLKI